MTLDDNGKNLLSNAHERASNTAVLRIVEFGSLAIFPKAGMTLSRNPIAWLLE